MANVNGWSDYMYSNQIWSGELKYKNTQTHTHVHTYTHMYTHTHARTSKTAQVAHVGCSQRYLRKWYVWNAFDLWVLIRSLKSTKRPASRFSKMVRDLVAGKISLQILHSITDLLCPSKQIRLIAQPASPTPFYSF